MKTRKLLYIALLASLFQINAHAFSNGEYEIEGSLSLVAVHDDGRGIELGVRPNDGTSEHRFSFESTESWISRLGLTAKFAKQNQLPVVAHVTEVDSDTAIITGLYVLNPSFQQEAGSGQPGTFVVVAGVTVDHEWVSLSENEAGRNDLIRISDDSGAADSFYSTIALPAVATNRRVTASMHRTSDDDVALTSLAFSEETTLLGAQAPTATPWNGYEEFVGLVGIVGRDTNVFIYFRANGWGNNSAQVRYGAPFSCYINIDYAGESEGVRKYVVASSTGGPCDRALRSSIVLKKLSSGGMSYERVDLNRKTVESGSLMRQ